MTIPTIRNGVFLCGAFVILLQSSLLNAQTLDQQYEHYLQTASPPNVFGDQKCLRLGFARDAGTAELLPGQAGPNLFAFCTGFPFVEQSPGTGSAAVSGSNSGAAASRSGRTNDAALRRRRENERADKNENASTLNSQRGGAASSDTESLFSNGSVFMSYDYRDEQQDVTYYEDSRNADRSTFTLGADYRFGTAMLAGVAISAEELSGAFGSGGNFETRGYSATLYASWLPIDGLFVDFSAGGDFKDLKTTRIVGRTTYFYPIGQTVPHVYQSPPASPVSGATDSNTITADFQAGYDFYLTRFTLGPRLGATMLNATTDAYVETGNTPMSLAFDAQKEQSLQTSVGLQASAAFSVSDIVIVPQINANWLHEYRNDQRVIVAHFAEDLRATPVKFGFLNQAPDRDTYDVHCSVVAVFRRGLSAFIAADKLLAHDYRDQFGASIGVRWEM